MLLGLMARALPAGGGLLRRGASSRLRLFEQTSPIPCPAGTSQQQQQRRKLDPRARQSEFKGLLSSLSGEDDGLLDVRFERKKGGDSKRRR